MSFNEKTDEVEPKPKLEPTIDDPLGYKTCSWFDLWGSESHKIGKGGTSDTALSPASSLGKYDKGDSL